MQHLYSFEFALSYMTLLLADTQPLLDRRLGQRGPALAFGQRALGISGVSAALGGLLLSALVGLEAATLSPRRRSTRPKRSGGDTKRCRRKAGSRLLSPKNSAN